MFHLFRLIFLQMNHMSFTLNTIPKISMVYVTKILYAKFDTFLVYDGGWFLSLFFKFWDLVAKKNNL